MKKKLLALVLAAAMTLSLASCGGSKTETPSTGSDNSSASSDNSSAEGATYKVGICQLVQHPALDAATQGFIDALNEALPGQVEFENKNASGEANNCGTIVNGFVSEGVDLIMANATAASNTEAIANILVPAGVPAICGEEGICSGCGVATLSISYYDLGVTTGKMAAKILTGEADISTMPIEYTDATPKYNPTICEELGIQPLDGYEAIEG